MRVNPDYKAVSADFLPGRLGRVGSKLIPRRLAFQHRVGLVFLETVVFRGTASLGNSRSIGKTVADVTSADRLRIYIDTSVLGGCFDAEFATWSNGLVRDFRAGRLIPVLSDVTAAEVQDAPAPVRDLHQEILTIVETVLPITEDVLALVAAYAARKILPVKYQADMLHIGLATVARVDALVSWNFKHIVRLEKIRLFNEVNVQLGHQALNILSPREVTTYEGS